MELDETIISPAFTLIFLCITTYINANEHSPFQEQEPIREFSFLRDVIVSAGLGASSGILSKNIAYEVIPTSQYDPLSMLLKTCVIDFPIFLVSRAIGKEVGLSSTGLIVHFIANIMGAQSGPLLHLSLLLIANLYGTRTP